MVRSDLSPGKARRVSALSLDHLNAGVKVWRKRRWPKDFHNQFYTRLETYRQEGLDGLWEPCLRRLSGWKALRPLSQGTIRLQAQQVMGKLEVYHDRVRETHGAADLTACTWEDLSALFFTAAEIKGVRSPVFASKLCHMLFPRLFPVIDRAAVGIPDDGYEGYWRRCQEAWKQSTEQELLIATLQAKMGKPAISSYPWATKITELCWAGAHSSHAATAV